MKYLALIGFLYFLGKTNGGPCGDISLSVCGTPADSIVDLINLPDSQNAVSQCQTLCASIGSCNYFRYDHLNALCLLLKDNYYQLSCQQYSGPGNPTLEQCFSGEAFQDSCDAFTNDECTYEGEVVLDEEDVNDLEACENLLVVLGPTLGASAFVFDQGNNNNCKLYKNMVKTCQAFSGPSIPDYENCGAATPTTFAPSPPGPNLQYEFCSEGEQPLEILNAWVSPFPIVAAPGGSYDISLTVVLKDILPANSRVELKIVRLGLIDIPIPCANLVVDLGYDYMVGSCEYDIDHLLETWSDVLCPLQECHLPLNPGVYASKHTVHFPDQLPFLSDNPAFGVIGGSFQAEAHTLLEDGTEVSCVRWFYEIKNEYPALH